MTGLDPVNWVAEGRETYVITKRGRPGSPVRPADAQGQTR